MRRLFVHLSMVILLSAAAGSAAIADGLNLTWREARVVKLAKPASSIVVGDPTVADVTLDTPTTLIVFGKTPGETNLLVLSSDQELLVDWPVLVSPVTARHVSVLNPQAGDAPTEVLYACGTERCTRVLSPTEVQFRASASSSTASNTDASKSSSTSENTSSSGSTNNSSNSQTPAGSN